MGDEEEEGEAAGEKRERCGVGGSDDGRSMRLLVGGELCGVRGLITINPAGPGIAKEARRASAEAQDLHPQAQHRLPMRSPSPVSHKRRVRMEAGSQRQGIASAAADASSRTALHCGRSRGKIGREVVGASLFFMGRRSA